MPPKPNPARRLQPLWIPLAILGGLLLLSLLAQLALAWRSYERILPADQHMAHLEQLQQTLSGVETRLTRQLPDDSPLPPADRQALHQSLQGLLAQGGHLLDTTPASLQQAQALLASPNTPARATLLDTLGLLRKVFRAESAAHQQLTGNMLTAARTELEIGVLALLLLPLGVLTLLVLMRWRIFAPLNLMGELMEQLGERRYQRIPTDHIDPMFQPLAANYNQMVVRLSELETEHLQYEQHLEQQVQTATRTLIGQQRNLAASERLAVLGEVMARIAHELRNPLAGIKIACCNLHDDMAEQLEPDTYAERLGLISNEITRMGKLLDSLLDQARHQPETAQDVVVDKAVAELLTLARYQMPAHISLQQQIPPGITCHLPGIRLRQVLLNLILNAQQAMAEQPGTILLTADVQAGILHLSVCDQGPGFPANLLGSNVQAFHSQRDGGTGLGLSMVQRFVRNLGSTLELRNRDPHGACVTLKLNCLVVPHV